MAHGLDGDSVWCHSWWQQKQTHKHENKIIQFHGGNFTSQEETWELKNFYFLVFMHACMWHILRIFLYSSVPPLTLQMSFSLRQHLLLRRPRKQRSCPDRAVRESSPATSLLNWSRAADCRSEDPCSSARKKEVCSFLLQLHFFASSLMTVTLSQESNPQRKHLYFSVKAVIITNWQSKMSDMKL